MFGRNYQRFQYSAATVIFLQQLRDLASWSCWSLLAFLHFVCYVRWCRGGSIVDGGRNGRSALKAPLSEVCQVPDSRGRERLEVTVLAVVFLLAWLKLSAVRSGDRQAEFLIGGRRSWLF